MATESAKPADIRPDPRRARDRFGWVLIASLLAHGLVVFGISFVMPSQAENRQFSPPLKITLVSAPTETPPEASDVLAQADSRGEADAVEPTLFSVDGGASAASAEAAERLLLEEQLDAWLAPEADPATASETARGVRDRDELIESIDIAFLNAQARPRELYVHANTRASEIAPYLENWRLLMERVGNLNYPDAAKNRNLEGELILDVTVRSDGSVAGIDMLRSSGHKVLDDGAERIVRIAAPFDPFPESMSRDYDTLHIIRTWKFSQDSIQEITR